MKIDSIHQFLPVLARHDAIGETVLRMQNLLQEWGFHSDIFVEKPIDQTKDITKKYTDYVEGKNDLIIYHHSIGSELANFTSKLQVNKMLYYHNVTPPEFFEPYSTTIAEELYNGRSQTKILANFFDYAMASSSYNRSELYSAGFKNVLPMQYFLDLERFDDIHIKSEIINTYENTINIIFVGRKSPNKKIEDILKVFAYFKIFRSNSKLFVLGGSWGIDSYVEYLNNLLDKLKIKDDTVFINTLSDQDLASYYRMADIFLCMSEHEGFCIPLVESMYFEVPIVAYNSSAIPDTLKGSGILVNHKRYDEIAMILELITTNSELSHVITNKQKKQLKLYDKKNTVAIFKKNIEFVKNRS